MWKMSNKKRRMAFLTALIGSLMAGSSVGAANLVATVPSDYTNSQMGGVSGSRVTTKVDDTPLTGVVQGLNGDPAMFSVFINGESQIFLRQYTYSTVALKGSVLIDADGDWASANNPTGEITAVPNLHAAVGYGNTLYTTGYDKGQIGLAKVNGKQLVENKLKTVNLKTDIKEKTGDVDAASYDTYKDTNGKVQFTSVHGEGLLIKDGYLYVAASVNKKGGTDDYDNGYLLQYKIKNDGSLEYRDYARIGKNTDNVRLNSYNNLILSTAIGGYQNYGNQSNPESALNYVDVSDNHIGRIHETQSVHLPEQVKNDGYDFRDMKVLPNGSVYILKYTLSGSGGSSTQDAVSGFNGRVYKTTMSNLRSANPDDWEIVLDDSVVAGGGWSGRLDAEYYTKRLWVEWGDNLYVYEDGDTKPTHQWEAKDFSTNKQLYMFNSVTMLPTDQVWGNLAKLTTYRPEGLTASSETKITVENADAKVGTVTRKAGITGTSADQTTFSDATSDDGKYSFTKDEVLSINLGKEGDHATNAAAVIQAKDGKDITIDASGHTLQLASKNYIASPVGIYAGNGKDVTITADKVDVVTSGYASGNSLTNAIWNDGGKNTASRITVNGDVNISMSGGYGGNGIAVQKSDRWGENSQESTQSSTVTINGNLKIAGGDSATWGIPVNRENVLSRFNNAGILTNIEKSKVTVTGDVDMSVYGNGITTNALGSEVSIGGGHIAVPQGTKYGYYTLGAYVGTINVNMNEVGSAAGTHDVQLDGDVFALKSTGTINLGLTTKNSYLNGIIDNGGKVNMWLQNGAVWTNEAKNTRYKQDDEDVGNNEVSRVTFLHGGTKSGTGDTAGVIIQTANSKSLTIDKFSGAAKVLYSHDSDTPTKILGGDVNIGSASSGSEIVLRTNYDDNMQSDAVKNQVLDALAKKLYYKDAVNKQTALSGKVEIAEGLTASSAAKYIGNIAFNQTNGQGSLGSGETPEPPAEQSKTLFTSSMTGGDDKEYKDDHVWQDQVYTFTKDKTTVQVEGGAAVDAVKDVTITADGNELDLTGGEAGIRAAAGKTVDIMAGILKVNGKTGIDAAGIVTLKGKSEITGTEKAVNVQKGGSVTLGTSTISGDVTNGGHLTLDAATTVNGDITNAGVLAVNGETHAKDLTTTGTMTVGTDGVLAAENINVNGGTFTANGSVSSTVKADKGGKAILKGKKTVLKGLVSGDHSSIEATLSGKDSALNGSLDGAGSVTLSLADQANWTGNAVGNGAYAVTIGKDSTWTGSSAGNNTSLTLGGTWNNRGTSSLKQMAGNGGVIDMTDAKAGTVTIQNYGGSSTYIYKHDTTKPADANSGYAILGGDVKISQADKGSEITLLTDRAGLDFASTKADEKNLISGTLNALAGKLYYTGYADGNLSGTVKIAEGLTASSASLRSETITFSTADTGTKKAGQGFYAYTPEEDTKTYETGAIKKSENIGETRESDVNGLVSVKVTDAQTGVANGAPSALYASSDLVDSLVVDLQGHALQLSTGGDANKYLSTVYVAGGKTIQIKDSSGNGAVKISAGVGNDGNADNKTNYTYGIQVSSEGSLISDANVEVDGVKSNGSSRAYGVYVNRSGQVAFNKDLTIKGVQNANKVGPNTAGIYLDSSANMTIHGNMDIENVAGYSIRVMSGATLTTSGGVIKAMDMANGTANSNYYALFANKGTINLNTGEGITAGVLDVTGDMKVTDNKASVINVNMTKGSQWTGAVSNIPGSTYNAPAGQFNLTMAEGSVWNHETGRSVDTLKTTFAGSNVSKLDGSGVIYQNSDKGITVYDYSGDTTVVYGHDANDPLTINGGDFTIKAAAADSKITLVTDSQGITGGFADGDTAAEKNHVKEVLNKLANKLFYTGYKDANLSGVVKIAEGLTASSAALKTGDISFSTEDTGTFTPGQGYYDYKTSKPGSQITKEFTTAITGDAAADTVYIEKGVLKDDGTYVFTADSTTITPEKHLIAGGAWLPQIGAAISGSDEKHNVTMDMNGNKLTVDTTTDTHTTGIAAIGKGVVNINNAGAMSVSATSTKGGQTGALFVNAGGTINIHNAGADHVLTLRAKSTAPANAAVIKSMNGVNGVMSAITVDGLVDVVADKSNASGANEAISAVASKIEVGGGVIKAINGAEYAIRAYGEYVSKNRGQVNVNVKKDVKGAIIGAGSNHVQLEGNIYLGGGMDNAGANADVSLGLNTKDSFWKGDVSNTKGSSAGIVNLYMGNDASWTGNNLSGNTVNANLDNATWTGYSNGNAMHLKLDNSIWNVNGASKLASFSGNKGSIFVASDAGDISVADYSGNTTVIYNHDADNPTNILGGSFTIGQAKDGSNITLITDNQGITKGFDAYDKAEDQNTVNEVLNKLAQKLFYTANDGKLAGTVKIAEGLTASSKALKTGDISFSTDATGTKTPGQGFYEYTAKDDSVITDPITGNLDKKYENLGIETEKGIYNFTQDTVIDVTKGDYSSNLSAIESSGGPITIHADGKNLDVSYHVLKGSNVARAVATGLSYGKSKDVTITAKSLKLSTDTTGFYSQGVYATGGQITIDADTTISTSAQTESNGIYSGNGGTVTMSGNLTIQKDSKAANYMALKSDDNGVINVNMKDGKEGAGIVKIDGDVYTKSAETYDYWEDETTSTSSTVNLALQGKDSSWNGRSLYEVTSSGDDSTSYGTFNLWLTDGATWTNEKNGKEVPSGFAGSHVTKLTGGSDAAHAGNIFQNDTKKITIDNYSGNTNIYYAHTGNGEAASDYAAGDTIIKHAEKDSVVSLITDNSGVNMSSADSIVNVLNSLAGKLTYSNFTKDENNLTGYVKIADGLTSSSAAMYTGDMAFSKKDGKGSLKDEDSIRPDLPAPDHQIKNEFTTTLTGVKSKDKEYYKAGVIKSDGLYQFTQNSSITTTNAHGADMNQATTIDAKGKTLTFNTDLTYGTTVHAIGANSTDGVTINAGKLVLNAHSTNGRIEGINVGQGALTINGNTEMNIKGVGYTLGLYAAGDSALTFNGNVTAMGDETSEWGLTAKNGAWGYYRCSLVYSDSNYGLQKGPKVTINGDVNAKIDGNCLFAKGGHAKLTINGGGNIEINKDNEHTYYAMIAECGTTSMNVNLDENYDAVSARDNKLVLKGNIGASTGAISAHETELYTKVNLGLATADSVWTGVAHNRFNDDGNSAYSSDKKFYGAINVFLQNGATWNNEKWGATYKPWGSSGFAGSHVAKFVGGSDVAHAGNIFQNDQNTLTIDNYSGNTNIYYAHTGNGEAASDYVAGDTIIRSAAEGSAVSLITDNSGIAMDNEYNVANVLNALAGKLTYSSFVTGEKNLTGYVKIADGLTASSAAKQTGNIAFNADTGKGSLENGSMKPGFTYPETQKPEATEKNQGITGDAKTDYQYKKDGILKEDGSYVFTQNPTKIEVESGAAVDATDKDINIDTTKAKLELKGETGIHANGADVTVNGNTGISGKVGIDAANGNVTLNGSTDIVGTDAAINAGEGGNVDINTNNSALNIKGDINANGGSIIVDSSKATGVIDGDVSASNGGSVEISLNDAKSSLTGSYRVDDSSSIVMNIANGATWNLTDDEDDAEGMSLFRMAKAPAATADKGLTINGGESKAKTGYLNMTKRTKNLNIASYSGWETIIYGHENAGDKDEDYKSGNTIINKAAKDSGVILSTDNSGINMGDKVAVEATLKALAHKLTYTDHEENGSNLTGKVQIADGLTASSASKYLGNMRWDENGKGQYVDGSIQWEPTIEEGEYETFVMKGARSAVTTSFHSWRDNMQDTYTGADLADEDGIFAKALGGKTSSDVSGLKDSNSYWGAQIGYDKALANGWHTGVAFDYRDGDSDYLLGGKGDNKLYSFGVYGVKKMEDGSYFRVAAKAGRVENEYDVYTELRNKLHADYKANAYGLTAEYGKTFGSEMSYITPKVQLTWSRVGSKDYTGSANNGAIMNIYQDSYDSLVGRLGFEAGMKKAHGSLHAGLYLAHEFSGDIDTRYFAKDGGWKSTSFDGDDTWAELVLGGEYRLGGNSQLYADFARDLGGDFQRKWKLNAGIRLRF